MGLVLAASVAQASDFVDTRLSFAFGDCNLLAAAGETTPNCPKPRFGASQANTQFFDNFNTRYSGFETLSHAVLYTHAPAFFEGLTTEAALAVLLLEAPSGSIALRDDSSYIRLAWHPPSWGEKENISLTGFPVSADRFRLGYAYRISWGGSSGFGFKNTERGVPGVKLQVTRDRWYAFAGAKSALILNEINHEEDAAYGLLAGAGVDVTPFLRLEAGGGYFQKGVIPALAAQGINAPVNAIGASAEAVLHVGEPVGTSVDFRLYRNDPEVFQKLFAPETYPGGLSYTVSLEGSRLAQTLADYDAFGRTVPQTADAVAFQARMKLNKMRAHLLALYRTLSFIQFDVPGFPPYTDFPSGTTLKPEMFAAGGVDYYLESIHFTPGIVLGVQQPASLNAPPISGVPGAGDATEALEKGGRTIVLRDVNQVSILPEGEKTSLIYSAKVTGRWDISEAVAGIGELYYTHDRNRGTFKQDLQGIVVESFEKADALGLNLIVQAKF
ncbi:MAG: hypothetical protein IRZ16_08030 [Myxococcaceae bacterium]|nr:hypothetical protein [Myxococcaceae bacterium]